MLVSANADVGAAKALFFPNFSLTAALGGASHDLSNIADRRALIWSVAGGLLQPIFQGWRITSNYEAAKARFEQAVAQYQRSAQNGFREVADALVSIEKLEGVRLELEVGVRALQDATSLARLRYDTGLANYLEILIADQQLFDQELAVGPRAGRAAQFRGATLPRSGWRLAVIDLLSSKRSLRPAQGLSLSKASGSKRSNRWGAMNFC